MLSVLIPVYNYNISKLVKDVHKQLEDNGISFEILCFDDHSSLKFEDNIDLNQLKNCTYSVLENNIGRSAIRNLLAKSASYDNLLFLDADTEIIRTDFIEIYLNHITPKTEIIYGGIRYQENEPKDNETLRWIYGKKREALNVSERSKLPHLRFLTLNFIIKKNLFEKLSFNEELPNLRHEDTLFALETKKLKIDVLHIDNPVMHLGLESSEVFLKKSLEANENLKLLVKQQLINPQETSLSQIAKKISDAKLSGFIIWFYKTFEKSMRRNLMSKKPSLFIFDIYRLGHYLQTKST